MAVITYTVVETEIGRSLTEAERAQASLWITDAELLIGARLGDITALNQDHLAYVVRKAVAERLGRASLPAGVTEDSEQIDDYKYSRKFGDSVNITDEWWELLSPDQTSGAFTIRPSGTDPAYADPVLTRQRVDPYR